MTQPQRISVEQYNAINDLFKRGHRAAAYALAYDLTGVGGFAVVAQIASFSGAIGANALEQSRQALYRMNALNQAGETRRQGSNS